MKKDKDTHKPVTKDTTLLKCAELWGALYLQHSPHLQNRMGKLDALILWSILT